MPDDTYERSHRSTLANRELFRQLAAATPEGDDPYYYRMDSVECFNRIPVESFSSGFHLPRKLNTERSDERTLGDILRGLPDDQGLFRLGWFITWQAACEWISVVRAPDEPLVITRVRKDTLEAVSGLQIIPDTMIKDGATAVLSFVIEPLDVANMDYSSTAIPFGLTEFLTAGYAWSSGHPRVVPPARPTFPIERADLPWVLTFGSLSDAALKIEPTIAGGLPEADAFAEIARKALNAAGIHCGSTSQQDLYSGLLMAAGDWRHSPNPTRLSSRLLYAVCYERKRLHQPWVEGKEELVKRKALFGLPRLVWALRDRGLLPMPTVTKLP